MEQVVIQRLLLRYWKVWVKLYTVSLMTINALKKLGDKGRKGIRISGENTFPVLESPVISIGNNNERAEIAELLIIVLM
jgi:hypothetical protein